MMPYLDQRLVRVALGQEAAEVVIEGGKLVNVFTREIYPAGVAIAGERIAAVGDVAHCVGPATQRHDARGAYLTPGLIDAHVHPEVSKITLTRLANAIIPHGTTSIMCSLDQIGVVVGLEGMRFMLDEAKRTRLKVFHSAPSRLPYTTPASTVGHRFGPAQFAVTREWPEAVGTWEYMVTSIVDFDEPVYAMAEMAMERRLLLHGHAPVTTGRALSGCAAAGMRDDHESYTTEEMAEKLRNGLYGLIRRATQADRLPECVKAITEMKLPADRLALCSDDTDCTDLAELGSMDYLVRYAISLGVDPITAIQMASLRAAEAYRVDHLVGAIAPGRIADIVLVDRLADFSVRAVFANGRLAALEGQMVEIVRSPAYPESFLNTVCLKRPMTADDLYLKVDASARSAKVLCIHRDPSQGSIRRRREVVVPVRDGRVMPDPDQDALYITVVERYTGEGRHASGMISGFGLKRGAIATSLSPDDDNIICIGASVEDMAFAVNHLAQAGGGQVAVADGQVLAEIRLPLAGIMADIPLEEMAAQERSLDAAAYSLGSTLKRPFFLLIFLSITAIPEYSITDLGVVEHATRAVVAPILEVKTGA